MRRAAIAGLALALPFAAVAQKARLRAAISELELRPAASLGEVLELQLPDVASGRSQRRPISDLMLRLSLPAGDLGEALRLGPGTAPDRDAGLFRGQLYVVSGGRLLPAANARCDRWIDEIAICRVACDGGGFGLARRSGPGGVALTLLVGQLPRGMTEGEKAAISLNACDAAEAPEQLVAPAGKRALAEIPLRAP